MRVGWTGQICARMRSFADGGEKDDSDTAEDAEVVVVVVFVVVAVAVAYYFYYYSYCCCCRGMLSFCRDVPFVVEEKKEVARCWKGGGVDLKKTLIVG